LSCLGKKPIFATMKKAFVLFFAFAYFYSSTGICINLHYCGGKVKSVSLLHTDEEGCCKGSMKKKDCCKEKTAFVKISDSQSASNALQVPGSKIVSLDIVAPANEIYLQEVFLVSNIPFDHAPPDLYATPPYLKNRVLRI